MILISHILQIMAKGCLMNNQIRIQGKRQDVLARPGISQNSYNPSSLWSVNHVRCADQDAILGRYILAFFQ
ncbi:hypothetical protein D3C75_1192550 [compost metagenome]